MFPAQLPSSAWLWVSQEASASVLCFALIQRQQHHSAAEFPAAAKEVVFLESPQGLFCTKTSPSFTLSSSFLFFLAFFFFFLFFGRGQFGGVLWKGKETRQPQIQATLS